MRYAYHTLTYSLVLLCKHIENILLKYSKKNLTAISQDINPDLFYKKIKIYSLILSTLRELEKTMSFPIFIVFSFNSFGIFAWLAWAILKGVFSYKTAIVAAFSILIICLISIAAAKVNEADKYARYTNSQMLQKIPLSNVISELDMKLR